MNKKLLIIGAGGHGRSVAESVLLCGQFELAGFVDDNWQAFSDIWGYPLLGPIESLVSLHSLAGSAIVAIGNNALRRRLQEKLAGLGFELATVVHPKAIISPSVDIGVGSAVMAGAILGTKAQLGAGTIINCGAIVDHHCVVEDFGHLGVNACMAGGSVLGAAAWMQAGSAIGYGVVVPSAEVLVPGESRS
jgi:sugar O-acyltransferase (sialic acid O-acetyltransferase NeuD family)